MIVVAGGSGSRMGADLPKQFLPLRGMPLLMHTLANLHAMDGSMRIVLALPNGHIATWARLCADHAFRVPHDVVAGGDTRFRSVQHALNMAQGSHLIGVHDGVRPFVSKDVVERCFRAADEFGAAVPTVPVIESLRKMNGEGSEVVDRNDFRAVQTPQCFRTEILVSAFATATHDRFTDDAAVVEATGRHIALVEGNTQNIKVTTPLDMRLADLLIG